jgi:hypothetical protein
MTTFSVRGMTTFCCEGEEDNIFCEGEEVILRG